MIEPVIGKILKADDIKSGDLFMFGITKDEILKVSTSRLEQQISELTKAGPKVKNKLCIYYLGWDDEPREIFEIPEVIGFIRTVFANLPEIFYFANIESYTFAILTNMVFTSLELVAKTDQFLKCFAKELGDNEKIITIDYYANHQSEFHNN